MSVITYQQKRQILSFLSEQSHWANIFDIDFFLDERRKWRTTSRNDKEISISSSPDKKSFLVADDRKGGGHVLLKLDDSGALTINDESHRSVRAGIKGIEATAKGHETEIGDILTHAEIGTNQKSARLITIPELAAYVRFFEDGKKGVYLDAYGKKVQFGSPDSDKDSTLHAGRFFHVVTFDLETAARWGLTPYGILNGAKLIVSKDLSIEPDLKTFNELDPEKAAEYLAYLLLDEWDESFQGPWQWRPRVAKKVENIERLQKKWTDSTEFSGYSVGLPTQFFIETFESGFKLATSLDHREAILAQTALLSEASDSAQPVQTVSAYLSPRTLLHLLDKGSRISDHRGRDWMCVIINAKDTAEIARSAREVGRANFGLTPYHFSAVNYEEQSCLIAMDTEALESVKKSYNATVELLKMIESGQRNSERMEKLLAAGADLRLIKPGKAQAGRTLANEMKDAENYEMLADLKAHTGVHELEP